MTDINKDPEVTILSIDAWRNQDGWDWNMWHGVGKAKVSVCDLPPRKLFRYLRDAGLLSEASKGAVRREDDGHNIVIVDRSNGCPLYAIAYGEAL